MDSVTDVRLDGRVVVVTGGGRGIGLRHALLLGRLGARIVVADAGTDLFGTGADPEPAEGAAETIRSGGGIALAYTADLSTEEGANGAVDAAVGEWGRIDVVVHNAGFTLGGRDFENESVARLDALLAINTRAAFVLALRAWPVMLRQGYGRLVFTSSSALHGLPRSLPYSTAKASLVGLTRGLAAEGAGQGIKVNCVEPVGATRMAENLAESEFRSWFLAHMRPEWVSPLVAVLASEACPVTGEILVAGGGRFARTTLAENVGWIDRDPTPEAVLANLGGIVDESTQVLIRDGVHASAHHAEILGFSPATPVVVSAGPSPGDTSK
jgi:NAD(P)-dependent dehydrogenase (short-subunit alcohol dehydrogenase family)